MNISLTSIINLSSLMESLFYHDIFQCRFSYQNLLKDTLSRMNFDIDLFNSTTDGLKELIQMFIVINDRLIQMYFFSKKKKASFKCLSECKG